MWGGRIPSCTLCYYSAVISNARPPTARSPLTREVLAKLREWQATILACQAIGRDPLASFELNFRFVGAPGEQAPDLGYQGASLGVQCEVLSRPATHQPQARARPRWRGVWGCCLSRWACWRPRRW